MTVRRVALTLAFTVVLAAAPQVALAATYTDAVVGKEVFATSTLGIFKGTATGPLPGSWFSAVQHTPLTTSATITGGLFGLSTVIGGSAASVTGTFTGGTVVQTGGFSGCTNQTYAVNGTLGNVGVGGGTGTGAFGAVLTHYRVFLFGSCFIYKATVVGTVTLSF